MKGGFTIRATNPWKEIASEPLYDVSSSFWDNFDRGPRSLTNYETSRLEQLSDKIRNLETDSEESTRVTLFGKTITSPVGVASGPAPNYKWLALFSQLGYSILTYKTMRDRRWIGHGMPNLLHVSGDFGHGFVSSMGVTGSITNSLGMPTPDPSVWRAEARRVAETSRDRFFILSVSATVGRETSEEDMLSQFSSLALEGKNLGADAVELNLSCPNVLPGEGGETYTDAKLSGRVVDAVRKKVGGDFPVFVKTGYLRDYREFVEQTWDNRVAYVAMNSVAAVVRDREGVPQFADRGGKAGICGSAIRELARGAVANLAEQRTGGRDYKIVGLGGVLGPEDAVSLMKSGADIVESATGALLNPFLALEVRLWLLRAKVGGANHR